MPHLRQLEQLKISEFSMEAFHTPYETAARLRIPESAIRFTHDLIDGRAIFRHDVSAQSMPLDDRSSIYRTLDDLLRGTQTPEGLPPLEVVELKQ